MSDARSHRALAALAAGVAVAGLLTACGPGAADTVTIYSGRSERLMSGILGELEAAVGAPVEVRYGDSAELAAQLIEEGDGTDADLLFAEGAGALGAASGAGRFQALPESLLRVAPDPYRAADGTWVATSARARVLAYVPGRVPVADLPQAVDDLLDPRWRGQVGYAPTSPSWQAFVTALRVIRGDDAAREWLRRFAENDPQRYESERAVFDAVDEGELGLGLIDHYHWYQRAAEDGTENLEARLHYVGNDPLGLVNVAGVGVVAEARPQDAALRAVEFLLSWPAQEYFANETTEYPVRWSVAATVVDMPSLFQLDGPDIDLSHLASRQRTLELLRQAGLS